MNQPNVDFRRFRAPSGLGVDPNSGALLIPANPEKERIAALEAQVSQLQQQIALLIEAKK
jgi:hypothetical protein